MTNDEADTFMQQCMALDDTMNEMMDGQDLTVCIAVLTKLVGELLYDMQDDPTNKEEATDMIRKTMTSITMSYEVCRSISSDDDGEFLH